MTKIPESLQVAVDCWLGRKQATQKDDCRKAGCPYADTDECEVKTIAALELLLNGAYHQMDEKTDVAHDPVNHPSHYTAYKGLEVIDLTEQMNFCRGNAVKYVCRAGLKDKAKEVEDLEKAKWYIDREIERVKKNAECD